MTSNENGVLVSINEKLRRGDIQKIAVKAGLTRERTGFCLNPKNDAYNQKVVNAALDVLTERQNAAGNNLKQLESI